MNTNERFYPQAKATGAGPEFGIDANSLKTKTFDLSVARDKQAYEIGGNVLWAITASDPNTIMDIRLNDQLRDPLPVQAGLFIKGVRYSRIYVTNEAQAGESITLLYCVEEFNNITIENPAGATAAVSVINDVDISKSSHFDSSPDVIIPAGGSIIIRSGSITQRTLSIGNLASNTETLRIGSGSVGAIQGAELAPGETINIETTISVYGYNPGVADQNVTVTYTKD